MPERRDHHGMAGISGVRLAPMAAVVAPPARGSSPWEDAKESRHASCGAPSRSMNRCLPILSVKDGMRSQVRAA